MLRRRRASSQRGQSLFQIQPRTSVHLTFFPHFPSHVHRFTGNMSKDEMIQKLKTFFDSSPVTIQTKTWDGIQPLVFGDFCAALMSVQTRGTSVANVIISLTLSSMPHSQHVYFLWYSRSVQSNDHASHQSSSTQGLPPPPSRYPRRLCRISFFPPLPRNKQRLATGKA